MKEELGRYSQLAVKVQKNIDDSEIYLQQYQKKKSKKKQKSPTRELVQYESYVLSESKEMSKLTPPSSSSGSESSLDSKDAEFEKRMKVWHINELKMKSYHDQYQDYILNHRSALRFKMHHWSLLI